MFSLRFSGSIFLINLWWQFRVRKFLRDMQSFHFVFKITILIVHDLLSRLLFH